MGQVWELDLPHNKLIVLLAMADHADHHGGNVYPSVGLIAWKTGYSENQTRRIIQRLERDGILVLVAADKGKTKRYRIDVSKGKRKADYRAKSDPSQNGTPDIAMVGDPSQNGTPTPTIAMGPEPSLEPSINQTDSDPPAPSNKRSKTSKGSAAVKGSNAVDKPAGESNDWKQMCDAVAKAWNISGGQVATIAKFLQGQGRKGSEWERWQIDPPMTPVEVLGLRIWRDRHRIKMAERAERIANAIGYFRGSSEYDECVRIAIAYQTPDDPEPEPELSAEEYAEGMANFESFQQKLSDVAKAMSSPKEGSYEQRLAAARDKNRTLLTPENRARLEQFERDNPL